MFATGLLWLSAERNIGSKAGNRHPYESPYERPLSLWDGFLFAALTTFGSPPLATAMI